MANIVGKRYCCGVCGSESIVTKGGGGTLRCCGQPMIQREQGKGKAGIRPQEEKEKTKEG